MRGIDRLACAVPWPRRQGTCFFNLRPVAGGPGTFSAKLAGELSRHGVRVSYRRLRAVEAALLFSVSWGDWFHRLCEHWGIQRVLRLDGIFVPTYFDNREQPPGFQSRRMSEHLMEVNYRIQRDLLRCEFVVYQSAFSKAMADRFLFRRTQDHAVVFNGVDLEHFRPAEPREGPLRLLCMGTLRDEYMLGMVLPVFRAVRRTADVELLLVGPMDAINAKMLEQFLSDEPGHASGVRWLGPVPNAELPRWIQQADILVHPRLGDWCPNVVIEAMACGLPVVCGSWGGTAELVGDAGVVVPTRRWSYGEGYVAGLADGVARVLGDLDHYRKAARARAEVEFDIRVIAERYARALRLDGFS